MNEPMTDFSVNLAQETDDIKLAIDLIYLLETHNIDPNIALMALDIVKQDLLKKVNQTQ